MGKVIPVNAGGKQIKIFNPRKLGKITTNLTEATILATPQEALKFNNDWVEVVVEIEKTIPENPEGEK